MNNNEIFRRAWERCKKNGFTFISSNGGTGKTTYFFFRLLRLALEKNEAFHVFVRFGNQRDIMAERLIQPQPTYSKRMLALLDRVEVRHEGEKFVYIAEKTSGRHIAQIVDIFGQAFYKPFGNTIHARYALFDEILAETGEYVPDEITRFMRLVLTMARSNEYHVIGLFNNTSPNFPYFDYFGGKNYTTHRTKSGAEFVFFAAEQYRPRTAHLDPPNSVQSVMRSTLYASVYMQNSFTTFPALYSDIDVRGAPKLFKVQVESRVFFVRALDDMLILSRCAGKPDGKPVYTVNLFEQSTLPHLPQPYADLLNLYARLGALKTNNINDTIFVRLLEKNI